MLAYLAYYSCAGIAIQYIAVLVTYIAQKMMPNHTAGSLHRLSRRSGEADDDGTSIYTIVYIVLIVAWVIIVAVVLYLAICRYRRNRWLASQGLDPRDPEIRRQFRLGGGLPRNTNKHQRRLLTLDEVSRLVVTELTKADIQASKNVASQTIIPHVHQQPALPELSHPCVSPGFSLDVEKTGHVALAIPEPAAASNTAVGGVPERMEDLPLHEENCAVCLEDFVVGERVRRLPCRHYFHLQCIDPWLTAQAATCPLCNYDVAAGCGG